MRFVQINGLKEGMRLGKSLYDKNDNLLLSKGSIIQESYIGKIYNLGYQGIYIDDKISEEIEVEDIIKEDLRRKTINTVKNVFIQANSDINNKCLGKVDHTKLLVSDIVEQIIDNKDTIVNLIDLKMYDDYTFSHCVNVAVLSIVLGVSIGMSKDELFILGLGAILHDIGKIFIDNSILNKKGKLTEEEYNIIQKHAEYGYDYLRDTFEIPSAAYVAVLQHHEKFDGTGYPTMRDKDNISLYGRIIGIADVYDALTSNRPYRKALLPSEAMEYIMANGGIMFDINLTKKFVQKVAPFPVGTSVKLSNDYKGIVIKNYEEACLRPKIKVVLDNNDMEIKPQYYNLKDDKYLRNITITSITEINQKIS
jgi:HD-GYP domain-containing protein (c-di-GMP phosphodiesterase class II)